MKIKPDIFSRRNFNAHRETKFWMNIVDNGCSKVGASLCFAGTIGASLLAKLSQAGPVLC